MTQTLPNTREFAMSWKRQDSSLARTTCKLPRSVCVMDSRSITSNVGEFSRVRGLILEDWLSPAGSP